MDEKRKTEKGDNSLNRETDVFVKAKNCGKIIYYSNVCLTG